MFLKMMNLLNELEILRYKIDGETQVNIILQSLLDYFKQFYLNYNMNKFFYSLAKLFKELQVVEGVIKKPFVTLIIEKYSTFQLKGKKK